MIIFACQKGVTFPCIQAISSQWAPTLERSRMVTIIFSGGYTGIIVSMSVSGILVTQYGWESLFYVSGMKLLLITRPGCKTTFGRKSIIDGTSVCHFGVVQLSQPPGGPWFIVTDFKPFFKLISFTRHCWMCLVLLVDCIYS